MVLKYETLLTSFWHNVHTPSFCPFEPNFQVKVDRSVLAEAMRVPEESLSAKTDSVRYAETCDLFDLTLYNAHAFCTHCGRTECMKCRFLTFTDCPSVSQHVTEAAIIHSTPSEMDHFIEHLSQMTARWEISQAEEQGTR